MVENNYITVKVRIEPTLPEPYILDFKYVGNEGLKERILKFSEYHKHKLHLRKRFFQKNIWTIERGLNILPINDTYFDLNKLLTNQNYISFENRIKADEALHDIELLLNKYLQQVQTDYEKLLFEKQNAL